MKHLYPKLAIATILLAISLFFSIHSSLASTNNSSQTAVVYGPSTNTTLKTGLVGWWTFDGQDVTANTTTDKSDNGNHGTRTAVTVVVGKIGQGMKFNGSTSIITATGTLLTNPSAITISAWIKLSTADLSGYPMVVCKGAVNTSYMFFLDTRRIALRTKVSPDNEVVGATSFVANKWYHVVGTYGNGANTARVYVNGIQENSNTIGGFDTNGGNLTMGNCAGAANAWGGVIDDTRVYSRALSAIEITALYKLGQEKMGSSQTAKPTTGNTLKNGLVGWWTMDGADVNATQVLDKSGNALNGTKNVTLAGSGKIGQALKFNGTTSYTNITLSQTYVTRTVSFWFNTARVPAANDVLFADGSTWQGFDFRNTASLTYNNSAGSTIVGTNTNLKTNTWYHVVLTVNAGTGMNLYINGTQSGLTTPSSVVTTTMATAVVLGMRSDHSVPFMGMMDDLRIYNRALSTAEITALFKLGQEKMGSSQTAEPTFGNNLKNGLVGWWTMDGQDVTANTTTDKSGQGNNGTRTAVTPVKGKVGQAMSFNGTSSKVALPSFITGVNLTMSAWIKPAAIGGQRPIINNYGVSIANGVYFGFSSGGALFSFSLGSNPSSMVGVKIVRANTWHHGVYTTDGATSTFYLDGVVDKQIAQTRVAGSSTASIGYGGEAADWWNGSMDDIRIYNRALSAAEVMQLYKMGK